jgi:hypothetical protein
MSRLIALALIAALGFAALGFAAAPASAQTADQAYSISGVQIDLNAPNAMQAREKAYNDVQRLAFRRLMDRLVAEGQKRVAEPNERTIQSMVRDVIIEDEKASAAGHYVATFTVRFKPEAIRGLLDNTGVAYVESRRPPLVVVPVMISADGTRLWDDPNPWRQAWARRPADGLVPFIVPAGELEDVTLVSTKQAVNRDANALGALARRYGAADVLVVIANVTAGPDTLPMVSVQANGVGPSVPRVGSVKLAAKAGETLPVVLARAADAVADAAVNAHKQLAAVPAGEVAGPIPAVVPISSMKEWLQVRQRLSQLPLIERLEVVSVSRDEAAVILHATGGRPQVEQVLTQAGFSLTPGEAGLEIRAGGAPR